MALPMAEVVAPIHAGTPAAVRIGPAAWNASAVSCRVWLTWPRSFSHSCTLRPIPNGASAPPAPQPHRQLSAMPNACVSPESMPSNTWLARLDAVPPLLTVLTIQYGSSEPLASMPLSSSALKLAAVIWYRGGHG